MNILITSAGRRVSLVNQFKSEIKNVDLKSKVFISDLQPSRSAAAHFADKAFPLGKFEDPNYIKDLLDLCLAQGISLIIPTLDTELLLYSENQNLFNSHGIKMVVSSPELIQACSDKVLTKLFFEQRGIKSPKIFEAHDLDFPVFVKPRNGSNSKGIYLANSELEIPPLHLNDKSLMFMEYMNPENFEEYTVDAYYDMTNTLICAVPRIRLKVVGGESNQGITKKGKVLDLMKNKFSKLDGAKGCITFQFFVEKNKSNIYGLEINPRFGGGYPFSYNAGANFPAFLLKEYFLGENLVYEESWKTDCLNLRFELEVISKI